MYTRFLLYISVNVKSDSFFGLRKRIESLPIAFKKNENKDSNSISFWLQLRLMPNWQQFNSWYSRFANTYELTSFHWAIRFVWIVLTLGDDEVKLNIARHKIIISFWVKNKFLNAMEISEAYLNKIYNTYPSVNNYWKLKLEHVLTSLNSINIISRLCKKFWPKF